MSTLTGLFGGGSSGGSGGSAVIRKIFDAANKKIIGGSIAIDTDNLFVQNAVTGIGSLPTNLKWIITNNNSSGNYVFAVAYGTAYVAYSSDYGLTWFLSVLPQSGNWTSISSSGSNIVIAASGSATALRSTDYGVTWSTTTLPSAANWSCVYIWSSNVVVLATGSSSTAISTDSGGTWSTGSISLGALNWTCISGTGTYFVAIASGSATVAYSSDLMSWYGGTNLPSASAWTSVTISSQGRAVAVASGGTNSAYTAVADSYNGWNAVALPSSGNWATVTSYFYPTVYVYAFKLGSNVGAFSYNGGATWASLTLPASADWSSAILCYNSVNVMSSNGGTFLRAYVSGSASGQAGTFIQSALLGSTQMRSIAYGNGIFIAPPYGRLKGGITSDGKTWTETGSFPSALKFTSIAYGGGIWVAVSDTSPYGAYSVNDGVSWTSFLSGGSYTKFITYGNGLFVAGAVIGGSTVVQTSPNGYTWTTRTIYTGYDYNIMAIAFGNGLFYIGCQYSGMQFTSTDGITWNSFSVPSLGTDYTQMTSSKCLCYGKSNFVYSPYSQNYERGNDVLIFTGSPQPMRPLPLPLVYAPMVSGSTTFTLPKVIRSVGAAGAQTLIVYNATLDMYIALQDNLFTGYISRNGYDWNRFHMPLALSQAYNTECTSMIAVGSVVIILRMINGLVYSYTANPNAEEVVYETAL